MRAIVRSIKGFSKLLDVSIVTSPAYPGTSVDARNLVVTGEVRSRLESFQHKPARGLSSRLKADYAEERKAWGDIVPSFDDRDDLPTISPSMWLPSTFFSAAKKHRLVSVKKLRTCERLFILFLNSTS